MNLNMPGKSVLGQPTLWRDSVKVELGKIEVGDLYKDVGTGGRAPKVVCVLSVNQDITLTVMETWSQEVRTMKVRDLRQVDFHCVPPWDVPYVPIIWRGWDSRPRCSDKYNLFG